MSLSDKVKLAGLKGIREVSELSGVEASTLYHWENTKPLLMKVFLMGCQALKRSKVENNFRVQGAAPGCPTAFVKECASLVDAVELIKLLESFEDHVSEHVCELPTASVFEVQIKRGGGWFKWRDPKTGITDPAYFLRLNQQSVAALNYLKPAS